MAIRKYTKKALGYKRKNKSLHKKNNKVVVVL